MFACQLKSLPRRGSHRGLFVELKLQLILLHLNFEAGAVVVERSARHEVADGELETGRTSGSAEQAVGDSVCGVTPRAMMRVLWGCRVVMVMKMMLLLAMIGLVMMMIMIMVIRMGVTAASRMMRLLHAIGVIGEVMIERRACTTEVCRASGIGDRTGS